MNISDFDYDLPDRLIAQRPPKNRGGSRLLVLNRKDGSIIHRRYASLADIIPPGSLVIVNDTKVIKARLLVLNSQGASRELLLLEKHGEDDYHNRARCLYRGKLKQGDILWVGRAHINVLAVEPGGLAIIESNEDLLRLSAKHGSVPLPPYMKRDADAADHKRYQTVFAKNSGSVAAPTASLNFTEKLRGNLEARDIEIASLTLHVGLGTFLPIRSEMIEEHKMHSEYFEIPAKTLSLLRSAKHANRTVVAIGTTVARTLEYAAQKILSEKSEELSGEADIFIYPGYDFRIVDVLLTNFHAPRSTVLMLTAAFAGWDNLQRAYRQAVAEEYAFLSYGDSMLIL